MERINFCLADANAPLLITSEALRQTRNFNGDYEVITIEEHLASTDVSYPEAVNIAPDDLAYVIYTSGSTGKPKGVMIEQHSLANYVQRDEKSLEIMHYVREGRVSLVLAAFSFDMSIVEEFVPAGQDGQGLLYLQRPAGLSQRGFGLVDRAGNHSHSWTY